jgi:hypothetical protein
MIQGRAHDGDLERVDHQRSRKRQRHGGSPVIHVARLASDHVPRPTRSSTETASEGWIRKNHLPRIPHRGVSASRAVSGGIWFEVQRFGSRRIATTSEAPPDLPEENKIWSALPPEPTGEEGSGESGAEPRCGGWGGGGGGGGGGGPGGGGAAPPPPPLCSGSGYRKKTLQVTARELFYRTESFG